MKHGVRLFVGGQIYSIQRERDDMAGDRCFSAVFPPRRVHFDASEVNGLLDSGAFTDAPAQRLTPEGALERQLAWEAKASDLWEVEWKADRIVSYDLLIDETWVDGEKHKRRWSIADAERAVEETVAAAHYLASQRDKLRPRRLVLACQGVDAYQYEEAVDEVLKIGKPDDIVGLGGWCILGKFTRWMPTFWATMWRVIPKIAAAGIADVHIFGVLYLPALGGLLWLCDQHNLNLSTDSTAPILACSFPDKDRAGCRDRYWRYNCLWWKFTLFDLRRTEFYRQPPRVRATRQEDLFDNCAAIKAETDLVCDLFDLY